MTSATSNAGTKGVARADREAQIVDVACRIFGESGFAGTSVADIAEAAGISKPLIYNYFGSKEGLYAVCIRHAAALLSAEIERSAALGAVGLARAVVTLDGMFRALAPHPWMWRLVFDPTAPRDGRGRMVLALGEATGHAHAVQAPGALHRSGHPFVPDYLHLPSGGRLVHEEHAPIALPTGWYRIIRQREYIPGAIRMVSD